VGLQHITKGKLENLCIPLPPLEEQNRIVVKVDQLNSLCDELEARQQKKRGSRAHINSAALDRLLTARAPGEFADGWRRISDNFDLLYDAPENVGALRKAILGLAVMGKLVAQDEKDEPASVLMEKIKTEKERLIKENKIKKNELLQLVKKGEIDYELPIGWTWCYLSEISTKISDGEHITPKRTSNGYYLLSARNVTNEGIALNDVDYVPKDEFDRIRKRCNPDKGDILISCSGSVGRIAIVDKDETYVMVRSAAFVKPYLNFINNKFLAYELKSPLVQKQILEKSKTSAQSNLFIGKIKEIRIAIPPFNEQKRIVARVDQLLSLCDELEAGLMRSLADSEKLMEAVVGKILVSA
jgi:type I restriction enzyme S subunit